MRLRRPASAPGASALGAAQRYQIYLSTKVSKSYTSVLGSGIGDSRVEGSWVYNLRVGLLRLGLLDGGG